MTGTPGSQTGTPGSQTGTPGSQTGTPVGAAQAGPLAPPRRVALATALSALAPGAGHVLLGHRLLGAALLAGSIAASAVVLVHLLVGLGAFESHQGSFVFGLLLRAAVVTWAFAALDVYMQGIGQGESKRRLAVFANVVLPGSGYLLARAWIRAASSLALLVVLVYFARVANHTLDLIYIGFQTITAIGVYHQLATQQLEAGKDAPPAPAVDQIPAPQIQLLIQLMAAAVLFGWVVQLRLVDYGLLRLTKDDIKLQRGVLGIELEVPKHQLSMLTIGRGWKSAGTPGDGSLCRARHELGATLVLGVEPLVPFMRVDRYLLRMRQRIVELGYRLLRVEELRIDGRRAIQLHFRRQAGSGIQLDRWVVAIPRGELAYVLMLSCGRSVCQKLRPSFEKTRDSLRIGDATKRKR